MSEVLFILTTIYVAYVVYKVADNAKVEKRVNKPAVVETIITPSGSIPIAEAAVAIVEEVAPAVEAAVTAAVIESAPVAEVKTEEKAEQVKAAPVSSNLRDPKTGEAAKVTNNYRGLKRWLKEALVAEGLLEKVYSNSELNDDTNAKIKVALEAIKAMSKYHA